MSEKATNVVIAGLGGQGVLKASDILADAAFRAGLDVKKSEIHGMSQRGGSVTSDVRFARGVGGVKSPMVPTGEADYLLVLAPDQVDVNRGAIADNPSGVLIGPDVIDVEKLANRRSLNVAMLGVLSAQLDIEESFWLEAVKANLPEKVYEANVEAFRMGRAAGK